LRFAPVDNEVDNETVTPVVPEGQRKHYGHDRSDARDFSISAGCSCAQWPSLNLNVAEIAALVGDPVRTNILAALMDGRALTSKELAYIAGHHGGCQRSNPTSATTTIAHGGKDARCPHLL